MYKYFTLCDKYINYTLIYCMVSVHACIPIMNTNTSIHAGSQIFFLIVIAMISMYESCLCYLKCRRYVYMQYMLTAIIYFAAYTELCGGLM